MIPLSEISNVAEEFKVDAMTIEKDYVINWILNCLSRSAIGDSFVFYGGTAIKRMYFRDHRFSEDIDLISNSVFSEIEITTALECLNFAKEHANINITILPNRVITKRDRIILYLQYSGYDEISGAPKEIQIDFNMKTEMTGNSQACLVRQDYSDLQGIKQTLRVMELNSILANKIGMLFDITRNEPRDLFDIWFLLDRTEFFKFDFEKVQRDLKTKYGFHLTLSLLKQSMRLEKFRKKWENRLQLQMSKVPELEYVISHILQQLEVLGFNAARKDMPF